MYCPYCGAMLENYKYKVGESIITNRVLSNVSGECVECNKNYHWIEHKTSTAVHKAGFSEFV